MTGNPIKRYRYVYRSAITGRFVSKGYAMAHKKTTIRCRIPLPIIEFY